MEENVGLIVFEHLGDKLNIHVVNIDFLLDMLDRSLSVFISDVTDLQAFIQHHDGLV